MISARLLLLSALLLPAISFSQNFSLPDLSPRGDFNHFLQQIEQRSPVLQKLYAANVIKTDMREEEARALIYEKLQEIGNPALDEKYNEMDAAQIKRAGIVLYALINGLINADDGPGYEFKSKAGFGVGAFLMFTVANFVLMPELSLLFRSFGESFSSNELTARFTYLTLAFTVMYMIQAQTLTFLVGLAPSLGYALGGTYKSDDQKEDIEFGDNGAKRINLGLVLTAGIMLQNAMTIRLMYNLGLSKVFDNSDYKMFMFALVLTMPIWTLK